MESTLSKLDSVHRRLLDAVAPLDDDRFARRPAEGEWSVAENVHHLALVERMILAKLVEQAAAPLRRLGLLRRNFPVWIVGLRLVRVKAPKYVEPLDAPPKREAIENLDRVRTALKEFSVAHGRAHLEQVVFPHPILGDFTGVGGVAFAGYHELRHLKQIEGTIRKLG